MKKWHVIYVKDSQQELKSFKTKKEAIKFINNFVIKHDDGYWIDMIFKSKDLNIIDNSGIKLIK
jgi:hypothetical protein